MHSNYFKQKTMEFILLPPNMELSIFEYYLLILLKFLYLFINFNYKRFLFLIIS